MAKVTIIESTEARRKQSNFRKDGYLTPHQGSEKKPRKLSTNSNYSRQGGFGCLRMCFDGDDRGVL